MVGRPTRRTRRRGDRVPLSRLPTGGGAATGDRGYPRRCWRAGRRRAACSSRMNARIWRRHLTVVPHCAASRRCSQPVVDHRWCRGSGPVARDVCRRCRCAPSRQRSTYPAWRHWSRWDPSRRWRPHRSARTRRTTCCQAAALGPTHAHAVLTAGTMTFAAPLAGPSLALMGLAHMRP